MKIGDLARAAQTQVETVRYYERAGLLPAAPRSGANYRVYGAAHVERLAFIRHCRALDMTLEEIRTLLRFKDDPQADCGAVDQLLDEHLGHVAARIRGLKRLEKELKLLREQCAGANDSAHCGILAGLTQTALQPSEQPNGAEQSAGHMGGARLARADLRAPPPGARRALWRVAATSACDPTPGHPSFRGVSLGGVESCGRCRLRLRLPVRARTRALTTNWQRRTRCHSLAAKAAPGWPP